MNLVIGDTRSLKYKYLRKIGHKTFYYSGEKENIVFVEELIFNSILKDLDQNKRYLVIAKIDNERYTVSFFNETTEGVDEESSTEYLLKEFTEDKIKTFIEVFIDNSGIIKENIYFIEIIDENLKAFNLQYNLIFEDKIENIEHIELMNGFKKHKKLYFLILIFFVLIGASLFSVIKLLSYTSDTLEKQNNIIKGLVIKKGSIEREVKKGSQKYNTMLDTSNNLFSTKKNKELIESINSLNLQKK